VPRYAVKLSNKAEAGLRRLHSTTRSKVQDILDNFLSNTPLLRVPGKVKKLKGEYTGILQYDVTDSVRIRYFVDEKENIVYVDYIGPHP